MKIWLKKQPWPEYSELKGATFANSLIAKREELAIVGVNIGESDYLSTIISSLPFSLSNFASSQLVAARYWSATKMIAPGVLILLIYEEYDHQIARFSCERAAQSRHHQII